MSTAIVKRFNFDGILILSLLDHMKNFPEGH